MQVTLKMLRECKFYYKGKQMNNFSIQIKSFNEALSTREVQSDTSAQQKSTIDLVPTVLAASGPLL